MLLVVWKDALVLGARMMLGHLGRIAFGIFRDVPAIVRCCFWWLHYHFRISKNAFVEILVSIGLLPSDTWPHVIAVTRRGTSHDITTNHSSTQPILIISIFHLWTESSHNHAFTTPPAMILSGHYSIIIITFINHHNHLRSCPKRYPGGRIWWCGQPKDEPA